MTAMLVFFADNPALVRLLRRIGIGIAIALALFIAWRVAIGWHDRQIERVQLAARAEQAAADTIAFAAAAEDARQLQEKLITATAAKGTAISKRTADDLASAAVDIDRAVAAKLRAHAARQARAGGPGQDAATVVSGAAAGDNEGYCAATGWLSFGRALKMAQDAEHDAAQARSCTAWVQDQAAAWPAADATATPAEPQPK